eukprot:g5832.t1
MMPLIKLVHPDLFAQHPPDVASTNSKSLKDLNTLIDAAEALEAAAAGTTPTNGSVRSSATPPTVDALYTLTFFHHQPGQQISPDNDSSSSSGSSGSSGSKVNGSDALAELRAELRFPPTLSSDPSASLRVQLRRQLDGLLQRVQAAAIGGGEVGGDQRERDVGREGERTDRRNGDNWGRMAMEEGVRVREGETVEDFYGGAAFGGGRGRRRKAWGAPPRDGIRAERASKNSSRGDGEEPRMTSEELRKLIIEHAGDHHHMNPWDAGAGSGFLGGGLSGRWGFGGAEAAAQARSRRVDDFLRSGRVQFAGVPVAREAAALLKLHQTLVKHFEHLELDDRGLWSTVVLVLRAKSDAYEVQVHSGGPVLVVPEKFSDRNLVRFLSEVLLSFC